MAKCCDRCILIDECSLYAYTPLKESARVFEKKDIIYWAQDLKVKPVISCYDLCKDHLSDKEKKVKNDIQKVLASWIYYRWLEIYGRSSIANVGLVSFSGEEQSSIGFKELRHHIKMAKSTAEAYEREFMAKDYCNKACKACCKPESGSIDNFVKI